MYTSTNRYNITYHSSSSSSNNNNNDDDNDDVNNDKKKNRFYLRFSLFMPLVGSFSVLLLLIPFFFFFLFFSFSSIVLLSPNNCFSLYSPKTLEETISVQRHNKSDSCQNFVSKVHEEIRRLSNGFQAKRSKNLGMENLPVTDVIGSIRM